MMEASFKFGSVGKDPISLKVDTPWTADKSTGVASDNKYGAYPPPRLNSKRRITFSSENSTSNSEKIDMIESVEGLAIDTNRIFTFKTSSEEDELGRWLSNAEDNSSLQSKISVLSTSPPITKCNYCDIIRVSDVSQEFLNLEFS